MTFDIRGKLSALAVLLLAWRAAAAADFEGIRCEQVTIAKALVGRELTRTKVAALERKYKKLKLKDLGAEIIGDEADHTSLIYWQLCDRNVVMLTADRVISDAIEFPLGAKDPETKLCKTAQHDADTVVLGFNRSGAGEKAWRVDKAAKKLVPIPADGLVCLD